MSWATNVPRGDLLPLTERPRFQGNWSYIQTNMRDDHFWNEDTNKDGHHKLMSCADVDESGRTLTDAITDGNTDPDNVDTGTTGMFYVRPKVSYEAPDSANQVVNGYFSSRNTGDTANFYKQIGMSALAVFRVSGGAITTNGNGDNWDYAHNIGSITRNSIGDYTITFKTGMPDTNYLVLSTAESVGTAGNSGNRVAMVRLGGKATGSVRMKIVNFSSNGTLVDPTSLSVVVIGG